MIHDEEEDNYVGTPLTDELDRASALEMADTAYRIKQTQRLVVQTQKPDANGKYADDDCATCGNEIGEGRLRFAPKNHLCIECATLAEKRR